MDTPDVENERAEEARLTEGERYAICRAAFEVYGPLGYAVGNHSDRLVEEVERVLASRLSPVKDESSYYCATCEHLHGYHHPERGCTMPLDCDGLPVMRTDQTVKSCGCRSTPE